MMKLLQDLNCAVYEMRCNKYPCVEIADALHISDEDVEFIDKANQEHLAKLEMIRLGRLNLSDFN